MTGLSHCRRVLLVPMAFAFALASHAQTGDAGKPEPLPTIRASARAVIVDVVVTTPTGETVKHLPAADFRLNEDGASQAISSFEEHGADSDIGTNNAAAAAGSVAAAPSAVTNILLLDALNTERVDQGRVRAQVVSYLKALPPGTSLSIFALESRLRLVHGPSAESGVLLGAVEDKKTGVMLGTSTASRRTQDEADARQDQEFLKSMNSAPPGAVAAVQQSEADHGSYQGDKRISLTLDALDSLGRFLARIPGRKNLIWFSGSFPIALAPDPGVQVSSRTAEQSRKIQETSNLLTVARIAVYPVYAAGVSLGAANDASDHFTASPTDLAAQSGTLAAGASAMRQIASGTGGEAFGDSNNLTASLARAIENGLHYYTLTYTPRNGEWNGAYRRIKVTLDGSEYRLAYREGYYAVDKSSPGERPGENRSAASQTVNPAPGPAPSTAPQSAAPPGTAAGTAAGTPNPALQIRTPAEVERAKQAQRHMTLEVVATDTSGMPVPGLHAADFALLDNGKAQTIASVHSLQGRATLPPTEVILLLDTVNATFQGVGLAREGIEKYLLQNGGHLALPTSVVFFSDAGGKIESASRDGNALAEDLSKLKSPIRVFDLAQGPGGALERVQNSIRMLTQLLTYEATRPGRKLLVWVGPGWPLLNGPSATLNAEQRGRYFTSIVELNTAFRRAQVTLYSVIPLDLSQGAGLRSFLYQDYLKGADSSKHADAPNLALQVLAIQSGGLVLDKNGDLAGQISRCVADANSYYELVFDAAPALQPDEYHRLDVQAAKAGTGVRTRTGYYAQP